MNIRLKLSPYLFSGFFFGMIGAIYGLINDYNVVQVISLSFAFSVPVLILMLLTDQKLHR